MRTFTRRSYLHDIQLAFEFISNQHCGKKSHSICIRQMMSMRKQSVRYGRRAKDSWRTVIRDSSAIDANSCLTFTDKASECKADEPQRIVVSRRGTIYLIPVTRSWLSKGTSLLLGSRKLMNKARVVVDIILTQSTSTCRDEHNPPDLMVDSRDQGGKPSRKTWRKCPLSQFQQDIAD